MNTLNTQIGLDLDLDVCAQEGYMMMSYDPDSLLREDGSLDETFECLFEKTRLEEGLIFQNFYSLEEVWSVYQSNPGPIDNFVGQETRKKPSTPHEFLHLVSDLEAYGGYLETMVEIWKDEKDI